MMRAQASKTVLKIYCKSFLVYLGTGNAMAKIIVIGRFAFKDSAGWLDNLSFDSRGGKKSKRATKRHFLQGWLWLQTEIILDITKNILSKQAD